MIKDCVSKTGQTSARNIGSAMARSTIRTVCRRVVIAIMGKIISIGAGRDDAVMARVTPLCQRVDEPMVEGTIDNKGSNVMAYNAVEASDWMNFRPGRAAMTT